MFLNQKNNFFIFFSCIFFVVIIIGCNTQSSTSTDDSKQSTTTTIQPQTDMGKDIKIIFLHHSTGNNVWQGGVSGWFSTYNTNNSSSYQISERAFPDTPWPWANYPSDYYRIWILKEGNNQTGTEQLETLTSNYKVIIFKNCYPVCEIGADTGNPDPASSTKTLENYKAAYNALKTKMKSFTNNRFVVWTPAVRLESELKSSYPDSYAMIAQRCKDFSDWIKNVWDEKGDNIYVWDFSRRSTAE